MTPAGEIVMYVAAGLVFAAGIGLLVWVGRK